MIKIKKYQRQYVHFSKKLICNQKRFREVRKFKEQGQFLLIKIEKMQNPQMSIMMLRQDCRK